MQDLLERSAELADTVAGLLAFPQFDNSARISTSRTLCEVSLEHAESVRVLLANGNFTSSLGVLRMQYEALVRSIWALYAASDRVVGELQRTLEKSSATAADRVPSLAEMLTSLKSKAPWQATRPLAEFKQYSWKPLSSYIHGGIHAVTRHSNGYPQPLIAHAARSSNALLVMAGMMLVVLSGDPALRGVMSTIQSTYADCCPPVAAS